MANITRSITAALAVCAWLPLQAADEAPLIPRRVLFSDPTTSVVQLSPDGGRVASIEIDGEQRSLVLASVGASGTSDSQTLEVAGVPQDCRWDAGGSRLIVSTLIGADRHVMRYDLESGESLDLTPIAGVQARLERISGRRPDVALVALNNRDPSVHDLWEINLDSGERTKVLETTGFVRVHVDADFVPRAAERSTSSGGRELLQRDAAGDWQLLRTFDKDWANAAQSPGGGSVGVVGVDGAGQTLWLVDNAARDKSALFAVKLETGAALLLAEDPDADLRATALVDRLTGNVLGVSSHFGELRRHPIDPSVRADYENLERLVGGSVGIVNVSAEDGAWLVAPFDGGPLRFLAYRRATQELVPLSSTHAGLADHRLSRRTAVVIAARDGVRLPCQLYLPAGTDQDGDQRPNAPLPTLLYVHGGPQITNPWESWFTNRNLQLLANRGYAVLNVDYRGAEGYGREFVQKGWREWGGEIQKDFLDIGDWVVDERIAQPGKVGIWGWSFGGLSTNAALAFAPEKFACGISMYGLSDMEAFVRYLSLGRDREGVKQRIGDASTDEGRARLRAQSPLNSAGQVVRPLLITHGAKDLIAPKSHSDKFVAALREHGKDVTYLVYPDEPHDYRQAESWISFWAVAERFLHEHLGGRYEPYGDDLPSAKQEVVEGRELIPGLKEQLQPG